jgi:enoyl-CoA hydratase/carnithine racemase
MTLLLATDIRIAFEYAAFDLSKVKRGILPGNGGTQRTIHQLPYPIAIDVLLLGRRLTAEHRRAQDCHGTGTGVGIHGFARRARLKDLSVRA